MEIDRDKLANYNRPDTFKLSSLKEDGYAAQRGAELGQKVFDKETIRQRNLPMPEMSAIDSNPLLDFVTGNTKISAEEQGSFVARTKEKASQAMGLITPHAFEMGRKMYGAEDLGISDAVFNALDLGGLAGATWGVKKMPLLARGEMTAGRTDEAIETGYNRGASGELRMPGTSLSRSPNMSYERFTGNGLKDMRMVRSNLDPSEVRNLKPSEYAMNKEQLDEGARAYNLPNDILSEDEIFFTRQGTSYPDVQTRLPTKKEAHKMIDDRIAQQNLRTRLAAGNPYKNVISRDVTSMITEGADMVDPVSIKSHLNYYGETLSGINTLKNQRSEWATLADSLMSKVNMINIDQLLAAQGKPKLNYSIKNYWALKKDVRDMYNNAFKKSEKGEKISKIEQKLLDKKYKEVQKIREEMMGKLEEVLPQRKFHSDEDYIPDWQKADVAEDRKYADTLGDTSEYKQYPKEGPDFEFKYEEGETPYTYPGMPEPKFKGVDDDSYSVKPESNRDILNDMVDEFDTDSPLAEYMTSDSVLPESKANRTIIKGTSEPTNKFKQYTSGKELDTVDDIVTGFSKDNIAINDSITKELPVKDLKKYREYTRDFEEGAGGEKWTGKMSEDEYNILKKDIEENGIQNPIILNLGRDYKDKKNIEVYIGEGNHRMRIAEELGIKNIPVRFSYY